MDASGLILVRDGAAFGLADDVTLELAFGDEENKYTLSLNDNRFTLMEGDWWMIDGTEYAGVVDTIGTVHEDGASRVTYSGRSVQGVLVNKVLEPDSGKDYLTVSGNVVTVLRTLLSRIRVSDMFTASNDVSASFTIDDYRFPRYVDAYSGLRSMLAKYGMKLVLRCVSDRVLVGAEPIEDYTDVVDSDLLGFEAQREYRRCNHLIGLGEGELKDRNVVHYYADADGNVSKKQSLFGLDEVAQVYDYSNADEEQLDESTREKLEEMQDGTGTIDVTIDGGYEFDIDDVVWARDNVTGLQVRAGVTRKIVRITDGLFTVDYEVGQADTSLSATSETSSSGGGSGGVSYVAGEGIDISGNTISADVTENDLDAVRTVASEANATASNLSASVGAARQEAADALSAAQDARNVADAATAAAATAQNTAESRVETVTASAPLTASRSGSTVTLGATMASQTAAGVMSAGDKAKLDGIEDNANNYELPVATTSRLGGVKPDGTTITISGDGVITAQPSEAAVSFLAAHPVGSVFMAVGGWFDPGSRYGGSWVELPSLGGFLWKRTA